MKKEIIAAVANIYKIDKKELEILYVADKIVEFVKDSNTTFQAYLLQKINLKSEN